MGKPDFVEVVLTCASWQEAHAVADELLQKYLVGSVEFLEVEAEHWRTAGLAAGTKQVRLIMHTLARHFDTIEAAITDFHGHADFTLQQNPLSNPSPATQNWLQKTAQA